MAETGVLSPLAGAMTTTDDLYGDGADHEVCEECQHCIECGDCEEFGCGAGVSLT